MKKITLLFVSAVIFLAGCTVTQEYHFNKDFSGNYSLEMEMGELITMIKAMDTTGNMNSLDTLDQSFKEISEKYKEAGATNVEAGWKDEKTTIFITFDFQDVETLNKILQNTSESSEMLSFAGNKEPAKFSNTGTRKLSLDMPEINNDTISTEQMEQVKEYLTLETIFSFDRRIKSISNKNAEISGDQKSFKFEGKIDDLLKEGFSMDTDVKLKRK